MYSVCTVLYTVHYSIEYNIYFVVYNVQCILHFPGIYLGTVYCALCEVNCAYNNRYYTMCIV